MVFRTALIASFVVGVGGCGFEAPLETGPEVSFATEFSLTDESITTAQVFLALSEKATQPITVRYEVAEGSAKSGSDFKSTASEVTFQPGEDRATISVTIVDDGIEEEEEELRIVLTSAEGATIGPQARHRLLISSQKLPRVSFVSPTSSADEPAGAQSFVVHLDKSADRDVVVRYTLSGTVEPGDHGVTTGELTIPAGQLSAQLAAPINDDLTDEDDETLELTLIAQAGAVVAPGMGGHVHTIIDDDPPPAIGFSLTASAAAEGSATATLAVTLARASEKTITIDHATMLGGTASTDDYTPATGTLTFPPLTTTLMVPVAITPDLLDEDDETVLVALANATNATLGAGAGLHALTITDDDDPPTIQFQAASASAGEAAGSVAVTITLSAPSGRTVQLSLARTGTSTTDDLTLPATTFTIPAGMTSVSFNATIVNDALDEDDETAVLALTGLVNATAGAPSTHTITIVDDDNPPTVRFDPTTPDRAEAERDISETTYTYRVLLSGPSSKTVTVPVTVGGSASSADYGIGSGNIPVVFQPGQTSRDIRITIDPDFTPEPDETITLTLGTPTNATNAADHQARTHTIQNDD